MLKNPHHITIFKKKRNTNQIKPINQNKAKPIPAEMNKKTMRIKLNEVDNCNSIELLWKKSEFPKAFIKLHMNKIEIKIKLNDSNVRLTGEEVECW